MKNITVSENVKKLSYYDDNFKNFLCKLCDGFSEIGFEFYVFKQGDDQLLISRNESDITIDLHGLEEM
ncbi:hypothetical protein QU593_10235 [Rossellomorea marisflavi]|uniref:hypothetical protein n=1 Tax=Rossellomorea marisflavi TaxID=189381 RepID=UPI0025B1DF44|nr:hypothetical protein [Rossellomorea marisflavi]WJV20783.1 hypothetical protein QU593_10235 [Rossellomorea marisflavi]